MSIKVTIGQKLYEPDPRRSTYREWEVTAIGRKWIRLDGHERCDMDLRRDRGGYGFEQLYANIAEYEAARRLGAAWSDLRRDMQYAKMPEGLTVDDINAMRRKLGLKVFGDESKG